MAPARPQAVVFDNDGLLLDTELLWFAAETRLFGRRGRSFTREDQRYLLGSSADVVGTKMAGLLGLAPEEGPALAGELRELVMAEAEGPCQPRPGALELLAALREAGTPIGLASNSERAFVDRVLAGAGLVGDAWPFDVTISGDEVARPKPAPDLYLAACKALGAPPEACVALEDSPPGVAAASAAGLRVVGVPYFPGTPLEGADLLAGSLADAAVRAAVGL